MAWVYLPAQLIRTTRSSLPPDRQSSDPGNPAWIPNSGGYRWVWQQADGQPANVTRTFRLTFGLDGLDPAWASIGGQWATDNFGRDILLNGRSLGITNTARRWPQRGVRIADRRNRPARTAGHMRAACVVARGRLAGCEAPHGESRRRPQGRAGLYWVRLAQGANRRSTRVAVIE